MKFFWETKPYRDFYWGPSANHGISHRELFSSAGDAMRAWLTMGGGAHSYRMVTTSGEVVLTLTSKYGDGGRTGPNWYTLKAGE